MRDPSDPPQSPLAAIHRIQQDVADLNVMHQPQRDLRAQGPVLR
jgi:hypothetical protein